MRSRPFLIVLATLAAGAAGLFAQAPRQGAEFQVTKISRSLIATPEFTYNGAQQYRAESRDRWLEVEVDFAAAPEHTDELTFKYFILFNGKLLTGEVSHVNIPAGRENRSVMYLPPRTIARLLGNKPMTANAIQNIAVQIVQQGAVKHEMSLERAADNWYGTMPQVGSLLLNKNETPFAPLYWDRYVQIKTSAR